MRPPRYRLPGPVAAEVVLLTFPKTLSVGPAEEELRQELRAFIAANDPGPPPAEYRARIETLVGWQAALCDAGFMGLSWPVRYGGRGMSLAAEAVLAEELARSGAAEIINRLALYTWGPTLMDLGEPEQMRRFLPGMLDASELWCQGFSEPDAGSDLAGVRTRGVLDGEELVITGQKVWTSRAEMATWNALLVRTDGDPGEHRGLTLVITPMKSAGITIRPLPQMLGEPHFSEVFLDEVRVPVANVLGGLNQGWRVSMKAMGYERGIFVLERSIRLRRRLSELAARVRGEGRPDRAAWAGIGRVHASLEMLTAQAYRTLAEQQAGTLPPGATSVDKLYLAEVYQDLFATAVEILGPEVTLVEDGWTHDLLESRSVSIYSGTSEIQKNVISGRLLGLR